MRYIQPKQITLKEFHDMLKKLKHIMFEQKKLEREISSFITREAFTQYENSVDLNIKLLSVLCDCSYDSIEWFIYDNDWGKKGLEYDRYGKIKSIDDFFKMILIIDR